MTESPYEDSSREVADSGRRNDLEEVLAELGVDPDDEDMREAVADALRGGSYE